MTLDDGSVSIGVFEKVLVVTQKLVVRERIIVRKHTVVDEYVLQTELRVSTSQSTPATASWSTQRPLTARRDNREVKARDPHHKPPAPTGV